MHDLPTMHTRHDDTIELREIIYFLHSNAWFIISVTLAITLASGLYSYFVITPIYQATTEVLVNKYKLEASDTVKSYDTAVGEVDSNLKFVNTYIAIMKSAQVLDAALRPFQDVSLEKLKQQITIHPVEKSQVISIQVQDHNYERAAQIANAISTTFQFEINSIMKTDSVEILFLADPQIKPHPIKPVYYLNIAYAFILGLLGAVFLLCLRQTLYPRKKGLTSVATGGEV